MDSIAVDSPFIKKSKPETSTVCGINGWFKARFTECSSETVTALMACIAGIGSLDIEKLRLLILKLIVPITRILKV